MTLFNIFTESDILPNIGFHSVTATGVACRQGWSSGNTLAYHTGDPGSIPGRGGSSEKCESI